MNVVTSAKVMSRREATRDEADRKLREAVIAKMRKLRLSLDDANLDTLEKRLYPYSRDNIRRTLNELVEDGLVRSDTVNVFARKTRTRYWLTEEFQWV